MPKLGYNINLGDLGDKYQEAQASAHMAKADMHLVMTVPNGGVNGANEIQEVTRWRDALSPARLVWRTYSNYEGDWIRFLGYHTVEDMFRDSINSYIEKCKTWANVQASQWHREGLLDVIRDDPANEPGLRGSDQKLNERYVIRCVELQNACDFYGVKVAIGAFSVGMPHESLIDNGTYDPILRIAKYFSVHEYPAGISGAGDLFQYEALLKPETLWGKLPSEVWDIKADKWLMRRCDRSYLRAKSLGNNNIKFIVTETNTSEDIPDAVKVNEALKARGLALAECGGDLRGHQAWRKYYEKVFNNNDFQENVSRLLEYQANYIFNVPHIIGVCVYQFGQSWGTGATGRYRCHNYLGDDCANIRHTHIPHINSSLAQKDAPDMPIPIVFDPPLFYANMSTSHGVWNLRAEMTTNSKALALLTTDKLLMKVSKKTNYANGYDWYKFKIETVPGEINGYFAHGDKLNFEFIEDDTTDIPELPDVIGLHEIEGMIQEALAPLLKEHVVDIPLPAFTMTVPELMIEPTAQLLDGLAGVLSATAKRLRSGTPTTSQYATIELEDVQATSVSGLPDNSLLDTILNGDNADAE